MIGLQPNDVNAAIASNAFDISVLELMTRRYFEVLST